MYSSAFAQIPGSARQGPSGIFIFLGKEIPVGKNISAYKIERSGDNIHWKQIAEIKTPSGFDGFKIILSFATSAIRG
jgi:hypothetical protein